MLARVGADFARSAGDPLERMCRALFPSWAPLNNAVLIGANGGAAAVAELRDAYAAAGVEKWALWRPSAATNWDAPDVEQELGGLTRDTTTLVMEAALTREFPHHAGVVRSSMTAVKRFSDDEQVSAAELGEPESTPGLSAWVIVLDGVVVTAAWSFVHGLDCGIYAVGTSPERRRLGLARSLMEHILADATRGGARTASLQSTRMGQRLYESLGFEAVGRYEEWASS